MKIHYLQHVEFEDLANIKFWAENKGYTISKTSLHLNEELPDINSIDWLIILGGPMNIYEENQYPWLTTEKKFIEKSIKANKKVLGICLGAQLIADVLGAKIYKNKYKEIGWLPVYLKVESKNSRVFHNLPDMFNAFHWHGDTFDLPSGCNHLAYTEGCLNQAFEYNNNVVGLQFHLEYNIDSIQKMLKNCSNELVEAKYIQNASDIINNFNLVVPLNNILYKFLDNFH